MDNEKIEKIVRKYKTCRWFQHICFILSILSCTVPLAIASIDTAPQMQSTESKIALGGVATFFFAIVLLIVFRSLVSKYISKLPYTLTALITVSVMLFLLICLQKIIDEAIAILVVGVIGIAVGFVFELISMFCKAIAEEIKDTYRRITQDV